MAVGEGLFLESSELSMRISISGGMGWRAVFFAKNRVFCVILTFLSHPTQLLHYR